MSLDLLGPANAPNATTVRPSDSRTFGATDTWYQDCPPGTSTGGTALSANWFNAITAQLRSLIRGMGITLNNADDTMLLKAVQLAGMTPPYGVDTSGTPGTITATLSPTPSSLAAGSIVQVKVANTCPGATTATFGAIGPYNVSHTDGSALVANDYVAGQILELKFDGTELQLSRSTAVGAQQLLGSALGMNAPVNCSIFASVAGNNLTVAVGDLNEVPFTATSPLKALFRDATSGLPALGLGVLRTVTSSPSAVINAGNTMGGVNGVPMRLWVVLIDNGGTVLAGLINCTSASGVAPLIEDILQNTGAGTNGGSSSGVIYTSVASLSAKAIRVIGYIEWTTPLATAGQYAAGPQKIVLAGPNTKRPGDCFNQQFSATASVSITPTSPVNLVKFSASGTTLVNNGSATVTYKRGSTTLLTRTNQSGATGIVQFGESAVLLDQPGTTSSTAYSINSTGTFNVPATFVEEVMG